MSSQVATSGRVRTRPDDPRAIVLRHLASVPVHRALIRSAECRLFLRAELFHPLLDIGCGDGHFASMVFEERVDVGLDPDPARVAEAARSGAYRLCLVSSGTRLPFGDSSFASVMSNCVLEHIPDVEAVLSEVARVLRPGGRFVFSVPSPRFTSYLLGSSLLARLGRPDLGEAYGRWFNRLSRHYYCDGPSTWRERLARVGMVIDHHSYYLGPDAHRFFDASHYYGAPTLLSKRLAGRWVLLPGKVRFWPPERWLVDRLVHFAHQIRLDDGAYLYVEAHRRASGEG